MAEPRALLFDFGGTLDADGIPWGTRFFDCYRGAGGRLAASEFTPHFAESDRLLGERPDIRRLGLYAMFIAQVEILCDLLPDGARLDIRRMAEQLNQSSRVAIDANRPMLERLARSASLGIVSNFTGNLRVCLDEVGLSPLFRVIVDSAEIGIRKPDKAAFRHATEALGGSGLRVAFIGDNPEADIRPALELGMSAYWLAPAERPTPPGLHAAQRIARLVELEELLSC